MSWKYVVAILTLLVSTGSTPVRPPQPDEDAVILVSIGQRYLWYVVNGYVIFEAPVAVGVEEPFEYNGKKYDFETPRGARKVIRKRPNPVWTVPEWHYFEKASQRGFKVVRILEGETYTLGDSTKIIIREHQVGRVNLFGYFVPFEPGLEIIFDETIFIPPLGTPQREVPGALGPFALDMGSGYLIHGTHEYNENSIGTAASHGCVRMYNEDIQRLYEMVEVGTRVYIGD